MDNHHAYEAQIIEKSIRRDFSERIDLSGRFDARLNMQADAFRLDPRIEAVGSITQNSLVSGRERYDRVASHYAIEPRDPYTDIRLGAFVAALPLEQKQGGGWPKRILRQAMEGLLSDEKRWRRGRYHVGWHFSDQLVKNGRSKVISELQKASPYLNDYIDMKSFSLSDPAAAQNPGDTNNLRRILDYWALTNWLENAITNRLRPGHSRTQMTHKG